MEGNLRIVQNASGLVSTSFILGHTFGHALSILDFELSNKALKLFRKVYQQPVVEFTVVLSSIVVHVGSGIALNWIRRSRKTKRASADGKEAATVTSPELELLYNQRRSGYLLSFLYFGHMFMSRGKPLIEFSNSESVDLTMITHGLQTKKPSWVVLFLLTTAGVNHTLLGATYSLKFFGIKVPKISPATWKKVQLGVAVLTGLTLAGVGGVLRPVNIPADKLALYEQMH
ncbi:hypothetical protein DFJ73DRAFT_840963 [Zopfochytrium polystomum]|nr:hypothetical protein DFJ73DRAFT_840963 [Zopfochytrium polystomum]